MYFGRVNASCIHVHVCVCMCRGDRSEGAKKHDRLRVENGAPKCVIVFVRKSSSVRGRFYSLFFSIHARNSVNLVARSTIPVKLTQYAVCGTQTGTHTAHTRKPTVERCANKTAIYSSEKTYVVTRETHKRGKSSRNSHDTRPITVMLVLASRSR